MLGQKIRSTSWYRNDANAVVENFDKVQHVYGDECEESHLCKKDCRQDCKPMPGYSYKTQELKRMALFHYVTRCAPQQGVRCGCSVNLYNTNRKS